MSKCIFKATENPVVRVMKYQCQHGHIFYIQYYDIETSKNKRKLIRGQKAKERLLCEENRNETNNS